MASGVAGTVVTAVRGATKEFHGIVVSAGKMDKTVKVKLGGLRWEPRVQKVKTPPPPHHHTDTHYRNRRRKLTIYLPSHADSTSKRRGTSWCTTRRTRCGRGTWWRSRRAGASRSTSGTS